MKRYYTDREVWLIEEALKSGHGWSARGIAKAVFAPRTPQWIRYRPRDSEIRKVYSVARKMEFRIWDERNGDTTESQHTMLKFRSHGSHKLRLKQA